MRKKQLQSLIEKEAHILRSCLGRNSCHAFKYNYYRLKLFFIEFFEIRD
jgi:hypothetical protein